MKALILVAALTAISPLTYSQSVPRVNPRNIIVSVVDTRGNAVRNLNEKEFRVRIGGKTATVLKASYSLAPRRIVVLLDMSASMTANSTANKKWQIAREALEDLMAETPEDVPIALVTFSDRVHDVFDLSPNKSAITTWLKQGPSQRENVKGRTALRDTIVEAMRIFQHPRPGDAIYAITDGGDNSSRATSTAVRKLLADSGVRLFFFLFSEHIPFVEEVNGRDDLLGLARDSGGFVFGIAGQSVATSASFLPSWDFDYDYNQHTRDVLKIYAQALNIQVNGFYTLELEIPSSKDRKIKLDVVDGTGRTRKDVTFTYQHLMPAGNQQ